MTLGIKDALNPRESNPPTPIFALEKLQPWNRSKTAAQPQLKENWGYLLVSFLAELFHVHCFVLLFFFSVSWFFCPKK